MDETYLIQLVSVTPLPDSVTGAYAVWTYNLSWASSAAALHAGEGSSPRTQTRRLALELSSKIDVRDPSQYPEIPEIQSTLVEKASTGDTQYVCRDFVGSPISPVLFAFVAPASQDTYAPVKLVQRPAAGLPWGTLPLITSLGDTPAAQQIITAPIESLAQPPNPQAAAGVLEHSSRAVLKATHVPILVPADALGRGLIKRAFVQRLLLQDGEVDATLTALEKAEQLAGAGANSGQLRELLAPFERSSTQAIPPTQAFASVPFHELRAFGEALAAMRLSIGGARQTAGSSVSAPSLKTREQQTLARAARLANKGLAANDVPASSDFGMLNLERLEMAPAGIERGALIATIPLAPGESTAVVQKEWSVTTKEFTSIVTDSLESISETGVTDNTELSQSTTNQIQHANQFNITGTVQGGIPLISGSSTASFGAQDTNSQSATDSRKHASEITQKASSRTKQEHKVTISTTTVTGTSETTTRQLVNPSTINPIRIDYFSLMRRWRVRLYRYGLRATFDIVIPEPAGALRTAYAELAWLKSQLTTFVFPVTRASINESNYQALADQYQATVPHPKSASITLAPVGGVLPNLPSNDGDSGWRMFQFPFVVESDYEINDVSLEVMLSNTGNDRKFYVLGSGQAEDLHGGQVSRTFDLTAFNGFMKGARGNQSFTCFEQFASVGSAVFTVTCNWTAEGRGQWQDDVWSALFNAAQTQHFAQQQEMSARIATLQAELDAVDTLTLRREESDEIMKGALRFLLGPGFDFMNSEVDIAIQGSSSKKPPDPRYGNVDAFHGIAFTGSDYLMRPLQQLELQDFEDLVRFINQAIEWENVVTFLYSYFWDMPESWDFIRQIKHPDANRQAFLRAGSARVVLTVRKGWEDAWIRFVDGLGPSDSSPRLTIAQEIAAYDSRNYPGIPPANSSEAAVRLQDAIYTTTTTRVPGAETGVILTVASANGFTLGARVLVDTGVHIGVDTFGWQEEAHITAIAGNALTLDGLQYAHGGDDAPYAVVQPGEKGALIAEWFEYTPTSGTDIAVTSNLATIS